MINETNWGSSVCVLLNLYNVLLLSRFPTLNGILWTNLNDQELSKLSQL